MVCCQTAILLGFFSPNSHNLFKFFLSDKASGDSNAFSLDMKDWLLQVDFSDETLPFSYGKKSVQQRQFRQEWLGKH